MEIDAIHRMVETHFAIQDNPPQYIQETIEIGNNIIKMLDEIDSLYQSKVLI